MYVDGVRRSRTSGPTGTINNTWDLTIGGKGTCDQIKTTCDYFVGDIDYVRIEKGSGGPSNVPPRAALGRAVEEADDRGVTGEHAAHDRP